MLSRLKFRGSWRKVRSKIGIRSQRVAIRSHVPWYVKFGGTGLAMGVAAAVAWWLVDNSYRITGFNRDEAKQQIAVLSDEKQKIVQTLEALKTQNNEFQSQLKVERASQAELAKNVGQLQEENASLKEDLGFLRGLMSAGSVPDGVTISNLKIEADALPNEYRYRMLISQGGQRKLDFKGKVQVIARVQQGQQQATLSFPSDAELKAPGGEMEFKYYQKVDGRFRIPEGAQLKNVQIRVLGMPGLDVRSQKSVNI
jgi:hypothetical protein